MAVRKLLAALVGAAVVPIAVFYATPASDLAPGNANKRIAFVCTNGVSMSVWAAATFNRLAEREGLSARAFSRASTRNYADVPLRMRFALALDGYRIGGYRPQVISAHDSGHLERVVLIQTGLPDSADGSSAAVEHWDGFPPMRERYFEGRRALRARVEELVRRVADAERAGKSAGVRVAPANALPERWVEPDVASALFAFPP